MADMTTEHNTPIIYLTHEERQMLREAWEKMHDKVSLIALQNDTALRRLDDTHEDAHEARNATAKIDTDVSKIKRMKEEERQERAVFWDKLKKFCNRIWRAVVAAVGDLEK